MKALLVAVAVVLGLVACAESPMRTTGTGDTEETAPETLEVHCDGQTTDVLTEKVRARADGVHVRLTNTSDAELLYQHPNGGDGVDPGTISITLEIPPGSSEFRCLPMTPDVDPGAGGGWASFEVLPPDGWVSPELDCPSGAMYQGVADFIQGARGVDDPLADADQRFRLAGKAVEAGYRTDERRTFVNVTDEGPKESFVYISDGHGGWLQSESSGCSD